MELRVGPHPAQRAAHWIARRLRDSVRRRGSATLALSGGSTAPPMIEALLADKVPWDDIAIWQVDERVAPDGHDARNANQLAALPARVRLMPVTSSDRRAAARRYAATLPERFDVVHVGLGSDGHTASWPPGTPAVADSDRAVELVNDFNGYDRMTLTRRVVNAARCRVLLTTGSNKSEMVERWLLRDVDLPVSWLKRTDLMAFLDDDAAPPTAVLTPR